MAIQIKKQNPLIVVSNETKDKLDGKKIYPRETYDDVICRLLDK